MREDQQILHEVLKGDINKLEKNEASKGVSFSNHFCCTLYISLEFTNFCISQKLEKYSIKHEFLNKINSRRKLIINDILKLLFSRYLPNILNSQVMPKLMHLKR
jgi:hypothetical protein